MSVDKVWQALGGKKVLGARPASALAFVPMARGGFPFAALEATAGSLGRSVEATAKVINIPQRTIYIRKLARVSSIARDRSVHRLSVSFERTRCNSAPWLQLLGGRLLSVLGRILRSNAEIAALAADK